MIPDEGTDSQPPDGPLGASPLASKSSDAGPPIDAPTLQSIQCPVDLDHDALPPPDVRPARGRARVLVSRRPPPPPPPDPVVAKAEPDDEGPALSVDHVIGVPSDKLDEFLHKEIDEPPESIAGVDLQPPPHSLADLMNEIGCEPTPASGTWVEVDSERDHEPRPAPKPLPPRKARAVILAPPPDSTAGDREAFAALARTSRIPPPPLLDAEQERALLLSVPPPPDPAAAPELGAVATAPTAPVEAAAAQSAAPPSRKVFRTAVGVAAIMLGAGIGGFALGRSSMSAPSETSAARAEGCRLCLEGFALGRGTGVGQPDPARPERGATPDRAKPTDARSEPVGPSGPEALVPETPSADAAAESLAPAARTTGREATPSEAGPAPPATTATTTTDGSPQAEAEFDREAAGNALSAAAGAAAACRTDQSAGASTVPVSVTFAPSGRVTTANVAGPYAGTATGSCIAQAFKGARIPAFGGGPVSVRKTVQLP